MFDSAERMHVDVFDLLGQFSERVELGVLLGERVLVLFGDGGAFLVVLLEFAFHRADGFGLLLEGFALLFELFFSASTSPSFIHRLNVETDLPKCWHAWVMVIRWLF